MENQKTKQTPEWDAVGSAALIMREIANGCKINDVWFKAKAWLGLLENPDRQLPSAKAITNAEFSTMRGARDMLNESAKHFRALKEHGHATLAEIHYKALERVLNQIGNRG